MSTSVTGARLRPRLGMTPRAVILGVAVMLLLMYMVVPLRTYLAQRGRLEQLERQTTLLERENSRLEGHVAQLNDPAYLERIARQCLGMVKRNEIAFVVVPKGGGTTPPAPRTDC